MKVLETVRKERSDKGKARKGYMTRLTNSTILVNPEKIKRTYVFRNRTKGQTLEALDRYEKAIMKIVTENLPSIQAMGQGSLPFVIGMLVSKSIELVDDQGKMRNRLIKATLLHLQSMKLIKVEFGKEFPYGSGYLQLT